MENIIEFDKENCFGGYTQIIRPNYISIGLKDEIYYLTYNETNYKIKEFEVNNLLDILGSITLNKLPKYGIGCDGETYTLKLIHGWNSVVFKWWSDTCGEQRNGLYKFREKLIELKDKYAK